MYLKESTENLNSGLKMSGGRCKLKRLNMASELIKFKLIINLKRFYLILFKLLDGLLCFHSIVHVQL